MITKYGYDVVAAVVIIVAVGSLLSWNFVGLKLLKYGLIGLLLLFLIFTLSFFRDPDRVTPSGDNLVISPGDGKVVLVKEVREDEYLESDGIQVSIFLSPFNVHVNRFPISGRVGYYKYVPGDYVVAFEDKSSERNERTHIGIENGRTKVLFKQIAGFVARRIVANVREGDTAAAGERFGMIKFGSRIDVIVPKGSEVKVKLGDKAVAGETVLAVVP
ncbi:MAG: phosphatidylserine decarboxylase family protein [Ignavibacteriae bacterium]|nr:phosphatidylserine decarboxylase family protein [Ignavibacteriota bacterium]